MYDFKWCKVDPVTCSKEELEYEIERLNDLKNFYMNREQGLKIFINSCYGAIGSPWFIFYNTSVAEAVTLQGQDLIKYSEKVINRYFMEFWHKDTKVHEKLGLTSVQKVDVPPVLYIDTDSVSADTRVVTSSGEMTIEDLYAISRKGEQAYTESGKEFTSSELKILNEVNGRITFSPVNRVIRHRVSKPRWRLKTMSGKEVFVTNDHSLIVLRDGKKTEVKPSQIRAGEKVICVNINRKNMDDEINSLL